MGTNCRVEAYLKYVAYLLLNKSTTLSKQASNRSITEERVHARRHVYFAMVHCFFNWYKENIVLFTCKIAANVIAGIPRIANPKQYSLPVYMTSINLTTHNPYHKYYIALVCSNYPGLSTCHIWKASDIAWVVVLSSNREIETFFSVSIKL